MQSCCSDWVFSSHLCCSCTTATLMTASFSFLMLLRPPRSTPFPYTTLFRSLYSQVALFIPESQQIAPVHQPYRSEEHTSELQSRGHLVCRLLLEKKKTDNIDTDRN